MYREFKNWLHGVYIYVWIFENGVKELHPELDFTELELLL